jgi:hypothetical protein
MGKDAGKPNDDASENLDSIDMGWDDDASGEIPIVGLHAVPELEPTPFDRVTAIPEEPSAEYVRQAMAHAAEQEEKSGVQPIGERPSKHPTPMPDAHAPELEMDDPMAARSYDDLRLDLVSPKAPDPMLMREGAAELELELETPLAPSVEDPGEAKMRERYAAGDFSGALLLAESLLETDPAHAEARRFAESCRDVLTQMYSARLGSLTQPVHVAVPPDQIRWLSLDHRAGFLLSLVDGTSTLEEILDISGMPRIDALRIMFALYEQQVIRLGADVPSR